MYHTIGFIGTGTMGGVLARAASKGSPDSRLLFANRTPSKARALAEELGGTAVSNEEIAQTCSLIFLGVKPQMMEEMLQGIAPALAARKDRFVLATLAAGLKARRIQELAGLDCPVIRLMPNTPAAVGCGVIQVCGLGVSEGELAAFQTLLAPAGLVDPVGEGLIDASSALSGCGPAFCALFLEGLADGGVACGLPRDKALAYAAQTMMGTARLMMQTGVHPGALKDGVCSPGGSTIQGVRALERAGVRSAALEAVTAAFEKTLELGKR